MMIKITAALMAVVDTCRNIGIFHCFSARVHFILCYDVILDKAQLHNIMLHVQATVFVISRGITIYWHLSF